jgi:hypothetical protein
LLESIDDGWRVVMHALLRRLVGGGAFWTVSVATMRRVGNTCGRLIVRHPVPSRRDRERVGLEGAVLVTQVKPTFVLGLTGRRPG